MRSAPGWRNKLGYLLREPGWSHDGSRETSETIRQRWQRGQQPVTGAEDPAEKRGSHVPAA
jgi:hypothetical protein